MNTLIESGKCTDGVWLELLQVVLVRRVHIEGRICGVRNVVFDWTADERKVIPTWVVTDAAV